MLFVQFVLATMAVFGRNYSTHATEEMKKTRTLTVLSVLSFDPHPLKKNKTKANKKGIFHPKS